MIQFTPTACYNLKSHSISFSKEGIQVIHSSSKEIVESISFAEGFAVKVVNEDFCFGHLKILNTLKIKIDLNQEGGGVVFDNSGGAARIVTSEHLGDPFVSRQEYNLVEVPLSLKASENILTISCPNIGKEKKTSSN